MSDALATLRQAIAPKVGMRRIPLPMESYEHPSKPLDARRLVNLFAEAEKNDSRTAAALISTPGFALAYMLPPGPVITMNDELGEAVYVVSGDHFWRIPNTTPPSPPVDLGYIGNTTSNYPITIAVGAVHVVVCMPPVAFYCGHGPTDLAVIPIAGGFPGASSVAYVDGYFVFSSFLGGTAQFFISGLLDPTTYDALDFANADAFPNAVTRVLGLHGDVAIAGESGIEFWYDAGTPAFPFRRRSGGMIAIPVASPRSMAIGDGSIFWVGRDDAVYRTVGYQPKRISTHAIEQVISDQGAFSVVSAFVYTEAGHTFYCLSFYHDGEDPLLDGATLVYDANTEKWHNRSSRLNGVGRWRASAAGVFSDDILFGDYSAGGVIWASALNRGDENGIDQLRAFTLPPLWAGTYRGFCHRIEVELEVGGSAPLGPVVLEWSDDGGRNWTGSRVMQTSGAQGTRQRVYTTRLGSFRQRTFRVTTTGLATIYAVDADISGGTAG